MPAASTEGPTAAVTTERHGGVARITLNRPRSRNAVNAKVSAALGSALERLSPDPELRVAVLTGAGRAFCAGMDLKEASAGRDATDPLHRKIVLR
ncbi:enoyl-CoA hydratase-related protein [Streptomyces sp. NPDC047061]|uniref:enoyl-CoA hydratase-related protein n=1 Tax=Streptomyces sp. NPDC047061 TaxID=3154605 RepID=UPI003401B0D6